MDYSSGKIDLHIHTTASDGSLPPQDILTLAIKLGIKAISLTDHDSVEGIKTLLATGNSHPIELLSGVEISAAPPPGFNLSGSIHILGYGINVEDKKLNEMLDRQQQARINRTPQIIARLNELGIEVGLIDIQAKSDNSQIGRPHIAQWLIENDHAASMDDAFNRYLGKGRPAYIEKARIPMADAIQLIRTAGGLAVLAHPGLIDVQETNLYEQLLVELMSMGLQGIEVFYPEHSPQQETFFKQLAAKLGLIISGGTDFHGDINPDIQLGIGKGDLHIPYAVYESIINALTLNANH
mgnify:CR=1 FL=1